MSPEKRAWLSTWRSRSLLALLALLTLLAAVGVIVWAALSNEVASRRVVELSIPRLNALIPGEIHYSSFEGTIGSRIVLEDLEVLDDRGEVCVRAKRVEIDWDVWDLATFDVDVSRMRLVDPDVLIALREDGSVNLVSAFVVPQELSSELREPSPWTLDLRNLALDGGKLVLRRGSVEQPADLELTNLQLAGNYHLSGGAQRFAIEGLASSIRHPIELDGVELSGALELAAGELRSDALDLSWRNSRLTISGAVQPLNKPHFDLALAVQSLPWRISSNGHPKHRCRENFGVPCSFPARSPPQSFVDVSVLSKDTSTFSGQRS